MRRRRLAAALAGLLLFILALSILRPAAGPSSRPGRPIRKESISIPSKAPEGDVSSAVDRSVLAGRIVWPDGGPWVGDFIFLAPVEPAGVADKRDFVRTEGGRFRFEDLKGRRYVLTADELQGGTLSAIALWRVSAGREDLVLTIPKLPGRPFVAIRAFDPDGRPVASAELLVEVLGDFGGPQEERRKLTDGWSRFALRMPGDRYLLTVTDGRAGDGRRLGAYTVGPVDVTDVPFGVTLPWERSIRGTVEDAETGEPAPGCQVTASLAAPVLSWVGAHTEGIHEVTAESDDQGRFTIPGFGGGEIRLYVKPPPPWIAPAAVMMPGSEDPRLIVRKGTIPTVTESSPSRSAEKKGKVSGGEGFDGDADLLLDFLNWPAPDVNVTVWTGRISCDQAPGSGRAFEFCPSQFSTEFQVDGLQADRTYTVAVWGVGPGLAVERQGLRPGPVRHRLKLGSGAVVKGRIYLPPGADYVAVSASRDGVRSWLGSLTTVHPDGHLEVRGLLPGTWLLEVRVRAGSERYSAELEARTGTPVHVVPRNHGK